MGKYWLWFCMHKDRYLIKCDSLSVNKQMLTSAEQRGWGWVPSGKFCWSRLWSSSALARVRLDWDVLRMSLCDEGAQNETFWMRSMHELLTSQHLSDPRHQYSTTMRRSSEHFCDYNLLFCIFHLSEVINCVQDVHTSTLNRNVFLFGQL